MFWKGWMDVFVLPPSARHLFSSLFVQFSGLLLLMTVGADGGGGTPVPIPNTAVKPTCAHDTRLEAARENRQAPTSTHPVFRMGFFFLL